MQSLTLVNGRCHEAFTPQLDALDNIRDLVLKLLSRSACGGNRDNGKIVLKRRVFERVSNVPSFTFKVCGSYTRRSVLGTPLAQCMFR